MQNRRDSSMLRSLALAFGDGLAFGMAVKLTQAASRPLAVEPPAAPATAAMLEPPMGAVARIDQKALHAVGQALEARLQEQESHFERRLADLEARLVLELQSLETHDQLAAQTMEERFATLREELLAINREFGGRVAGIIANEVAAQTESRAAALELLLDGRIQAAVGNAVETAVAQRLTAEAAERARQHAAFDQRLSTAESHATALRNSFDSHVTASLQESEQRNREASEFRHRLAEVESNVLDVILAIGDMCRQAAQRIVRPSAKPDPLADAQAAPAEHPVAAEPELPPAASVPGFTQIERGARLWKVPMVSSLLLVTGGLIVMFYQ